MITRCNKSSKLSIYGSVCRLSFYLSINWHKLLSNRLIPYHCDNSYWSCYSPTPPKIITNLFITQNVKSLVFGLGWDLITSFNWTSDAFNTVTTEDLILIHKNKAKFNQYIKTNKPPDKDRTGLFNLWHSVFIFRNKQYWCRKRG